MAASILDIAWIKEKMPDAEEHIKRKLPSMYHQFKQLADLDITKEPMEVGPTTHYIMGGIRVDADSQMSTIPGLFAAGECASGINGANRLGGNSLSDLIVFGKRAGEYAAACARENGAPRLDEGAVARAEQTALEPFERGAQGENPYKVQSDLQETMQALVGIVRIESEMRQALEALDGYKARAARVGVSGSRDYHSGWHTCLDLRNLLTVSEAIARSAIERRESRGGHFREDYPDKHAEFATINVMVKQAGGAMQVSRVPIAADSGRTEAGDRGAEVVIAEATFKIWRTHPEGDGTFQTFHTKVSEGMVVLDVVHRIQAEQAPDLAVRWNCKAGKCGSCSAEINGNPRLMCMTRLSELNLVGAGHGGADARVSADQGSGHRRLVELPRQEGDPEVPASPGRCARRHVADGAARRRSRPGVPQVHRVLPVPGRLPRPARPQQARGVHRAAVLRLQRRARDASARYGRPHAGAQGREGHRLLQHHQMLHEGVPRAHPHH